VEENSWYEMYVCDAAASRYVQGYSDGTFRPGEPVNRVEALKMILEIFEIRVDEITEERRDVVKFVDVSTSAWYTKYLYEAFENGILPIVGQEGARFYPNWPLLRGEAAAYIYNALTVQIFEEREQTEAQQLSETQDVIDQITTEESISVDTTTDNELTTSSANMRNVNFPFTTSDKFNKKRVKSYTFSLSKSTVAKITASLQSGQTGKIMCRLYRMKDDGISMEYYLGYQEGKKCYLKTALDAGDYQVDLQPTSSDVTFTVASEVAKSDGNDGFREATLLSTGLTKTEMLQEHDFLDFYRFTVPSEKKMKLTISNSAELSCLIYAMEDVDLYGFSGLTCGYSYIYPSGTYYVAVGREKPRTVSQTYTIQLY